MSDGIPVLNVTVSHTLKDCPGRDFVFMRLNDIDDHREHNPPLMGIERERFNSALTPLLAYERNGSISTSMFKGANTGGLPQGVEEKDTIIREVNLSSLAATQQQVDVAGLKAYANGVGKEKDLPIVVDNGGELLVANGTHRLASLILAGRTSAFVRYAKIQTIDKSAWTATFVSPSELK